MEISNTTLDRVYKSLIIFVILIAGIVILKDIVLPIIFAALFSIVMLPLVKRVEKKGGKFFSISILLTSALALLALATWFIITQLTSLVSSLPGLEDKFYILINSVSISLHEQFDITSDEQGQLLKEAFKSISSYAPSLLVSTTYLAYFFIQVPIYIFLLLLYRNRFKGFLSMLNPDSDLKWISEIQQVVRGYISGLGLVVFIAGVLNSVGLLILGIDHAIFFGFLSGMLTMIPYVGITVGAALPTLLALVTKDSIWYALGVIGVHTFVQFLESNFITPKITGSRISINALAAILALLIGGKLWGIAGMILAVPAVGILKIILGYSPTFKAVAFLLSDEPPQKTE